MNQNNPSLDVNETIAKTEAFISRYKKVIIIALVAVVALVALGFGSSFYLKGENEKGQAELALGQRYIATGEWDKAIKGDGANFKGYEKIAATYSLTDAGNLAHLYAGLAYFNKGDYKQAIAHLENFSVQGDGTVSANALAALADAYVAEKQVDKAVNLLKKAADKADSPALSPLYLVRAGELLESQNKKTEAHELYLKVKNEYPTSSISMVNQQGDNVIDAEIEKYLERTK